MTQISLARQSKITEEMNIVAIDEGIDPKKIRELISLGHVVIPKNINHHFSPKGIGKGLRTKINANIGTSMGHCDINEELDKLKIAILSGSDSVMDLSTAGDLYSIRKLIIENSNVMVGAVPIYAVFASLVSQNKELFDMTDDYLFDSIEEQCSQGIDYMTVHCGVTMKTYSMCDKSNRIAGIVSRGGALIAAWMHHHKKENPLYEYYDRLLDIAFKYDVTLSLGDGLRPGSIADATDAAQIEELIVLGDLTRRARARGVQVMIEGPGHVPLNQIQANIIIQKRLCDEAPFYVLGPLTTDCAPGYDHITSAIGGAIASAHGADFLCYVTPAEHLCLPTVEDVRLGVIAAKIAAHSGDIAKGIHNSLDRDIKMSQFRKDLDWEGMYKMAIDPELPKKRRQDTEKKVCTMCGKLCAIDIHNKMVK
ncbi:MAG: phosphomethylpyrimidine synthase ThiC [Desulfobacterales bacterium]|nr:phosphomethylpyrimidine synthase ThiC [Desulfobacterales bacterium]MBF0396472.1 phosphomethylpyrimidine synthase ThiC [Desulfobacterales bacterium]